MADVSRSAPGPRSIDALRPQPQHHDFRRPRRRCRWATCSRKWNGCRPSRICPTACERRESGDVQRMKELFGGFAAAMVIGLLLHLRRAGAAVPRLHAAARRFSALPPVRRRCARRMLLLWLWVVAPIPDRPAHADGHRHEELDPAGRVRGDGAARARHVALRRPDRCLREARPAHRDDDHRDDRGHDAGRCRVLGATRASARPWASR